MTVTPSKPSSTEAIAPIEPALSPGVHAGSEAARPRVLFLRIAPNLLVRDRHPRDILWPVQALIAAAQLRQQQITAHVIDTWQSCPSVRTLLEQIEAWKPSHLLIDCRTPTAAWTLQFAGVLKARSPELILIGHGQHPSERPEDFLSPHCPWMKRALEPTLRALWPAKRPVLSQWEQAPFDLCISGELEACILPIIQGATVAGMLRWDSTLQCVTGPNGNTTDRAQVMDVDALPYPDPMGLQLSQYRMLSLHVPGFRRPRWGFTLSSRGCAYPCTFCSPTLRQSYGKQFRAQSPERLADELAWQYHHHHIDAFYAIDDLFTGDQDRVHHFCAEMIRRRLPIRWTVQTRLDHLDRDLLRQMKRAGCVGIKVGIESGSLRISRLIRKELDPRHALQVSKEMRQIGIPLTACFLIGNPTETLAEMEETYRFACRLDPFMIQVAYHTPYPGSESYAQYAQALDVEGRSHFDGKPLNLSAESDASLVRFHRSFYLRYYLSPRHLFRYLLRRAPNTLAQGYEFQMILQTGKYLIQEHLLQAEGT